MPSLCIFTEHEPNDYLSLEEMSFGSGVQLNGLAPSATLTVKDLKTFGTDFADTPEAYVELIFDDFSSNGLSYTGSKTRISYNNLDRLKENLKIKTDELREYQKVLANP